MRQTEQESGKRAGLTSSERERLKDSSGRRYVVCGVTKGVRRLLREAFAIARWTLERLRSVLCLGRVNRSRCSAPSTRLLHGRKR